MWRNLNAIGAQNPAEGGVYGVTVLLLDEAGAVVASVVTGNGPVYYMFDVLPETYRVHVLLPEGYSFTTPGGGSEDSDVDEYGYSAFVIVTGGEFFDLDAGMIPPA